MTLRFHHLLCTQSYHGEGYSAAFVQGMDAITHRLRTQPQAEIELVFGTDDVCTHCPNRLGQNHCTDNQKVNRLDARTAAAFGLQEGRYTYKELLAKIQRNLTEEALQSICGDCCWYESAGCRSFFCGWAQRLSVDSIV